MDVQGDGGRRRGRSETEGDGGRRRETEGDGGRRRETEGDGGRRRETEGDKWREESDGGSISNNFIENDTYVHLQPFNFIPPKVTGHVAVMPNSNDMYVFGGTKSLTEGYSTMFYYNHGIFFFAGFWAWIGSECWGQ
jgi:hypothetical protein